MKTYIYTFTVVGNSAFPIDMLRCDACYPSTTDDSIGIITAGELATMPSDESIRVTLDHKHAGPWAPSVKRWESFGWQVRDVWRIEVRQ